MQNTQRIFEQMVTLLLLPGSSAGLIRSTTASRLIDFWISGAFP